MQVKGIKERRIQWDRFNKCYKEKYLSSRYYDNKIKEFNELKLGPKSMKKHVHKFWNCCAMYITSKMKYLKSNASLELYLRISEIGSSLLIHQILMNPLGWPCIVMSRAKEN